MLIKGEKYACDACIRGHRVSSCQHNERPLTHINKKGRPVSQCPHCRGLRKARSTHAKCECADKAHTKEQCPHNRETAEGKDQKICCCSHGNRCSCALKKEPHLDPVPEDKFEASPPTSYESPRPRPNATQSESTLAILTGNNYKPIHHKHNDMAHKCGAPYKRDRPHTIHGHAEVAQRSLDGLPLNKRPLLAQETPFHPDSVTSAPQPSRRVKSEHGSPELSAVTVPDPLLGGPYSQSMDSPFTAGSPSSLPLSSSERYTDSYFTPSQDYEAPLHSAGLKEPVDWSSFNIPYENGDNYSATVTSQPHSYPSFDWNNHLSQRGFASSSGEISEAEELANPTQDRIRDTREVGSDAEFEAETDGYRHGAIGDYNGIPVSASNPENLDIDAYLKTAEEETKAMHQRNLEMRTSMSNSPLSAADPSQPNAGTPDFPPTMRMDVKSSMSNSPMSSTGPIQQSPAVMNNDFASSTSSQGQQFPAFHNTSPPSSGPSGLEHSLTVHEAQRYAHMSDTSLDAQTKHDQTMRPGVGTAPGDDPMWSYSAETPSSLNLMDHEGGAY